MSHTQRLSKVHVHNELVGHHNEGSFFIVGNLTGEVCNMMLLREFFSKLCEIYLFEQDSASAPYDR